MRIGGRAAVCVAVLACAGGCRGTRVTLFSVESAARDAVTEGPAPASKTVTVYDDAPIGADTGISTGSCLDVDGWRYANVFVEFEQHGPDEKPLSLGVVFAPDAGGKRGSRRYFNFEENFPGEANPRMITLSGKGSWHGSPHDKSSYVARLPVMGPYLQVFPYNHHSAPRNFTVVIYLTR